MTNERTYTWASKTVTEPGWYWVKLSFDSKRTYIAMTYVSEGNISRKKLQIKYGDHFVYPYEFGNDQHCEVSFSERIEPPRED